MRVFFQLSMAFALAIGAVTPAIAQEGYPRALACADKSGAEQISGCTAWLESGNLDDEDAEQAFFIRGYAYYEAKNYARAISDFSSAIRLNASDAVTFLARANAYDHQGDYARAIADYGAVIRLDPRQLNAFNNRGWAYYRLKKYTRAIADYDAAIRLDPRNVRAFYVRGLAKAKLGHSQASKADIARAIAIDPDIANKFAKATLPTGHRVHSPKTPR
jgi:tetratricopeptide (TPR) repeat protein